MSAAPFPQIAGNSQLLDELRQMKQAKRLPHALLLHGEQGCGKKTLAQWFTMLVLCEETGGTHVPCGRCRNCRLILENAHPDVYTAEHSGKRMGFSVETVREVRREAAVMPNNGDTRIFLFPDADGMSVQAQNALLKSVEEPPPHACFVFTAETVGALLPTLLSRMTTKAVYPVSQEECEGALNRLGYSQEDASAAYQRFGGNIGRCIAYLSDAGLRQSAELAAQMTAAIAAQNEYELLRLLTAAAADKDGLRQTLGLLDIQLRDAAVFTMDGEFTRLGCDVRAAKALSERLSPRRLLRMHGAINEALADLDGNVGAVLTVSALCAAMAEC